jgi:hypothetical protein
LALILLAVTAAYAHLSGAWFCGYDDFNESYRAQFFDGPQPIRILTAGHFTPIMYRPFTSALQLATWDAGHGPLAFRVRNLAMHLLSICIVYGIAFLLGRSRSAAAAAAALFGLSPFVNEAIAVAIWTNATAYAQLLGSFLLFVLALRAQAAGRRWALALGGSVFAAFVALFTYEPTIVIFGLTLAYVALCVRPLPPRGFLGAYALGAAFVLIAFFAARRVIGVHSAPLLPLGTIAKDFVEYFFAVALPIDPVLAHAVFGVPLPSGDAGLAPSSLVPAAIAAAVLLAATVAGTRAPIRRQFATLPWPTLAFSIVAMPLSIVPVVFYREHVSEFNLYVPAAFFAVAVALTLRHLARNRTVFAAITGLLLASYLAGTLVRNERVVACARVAHAIVAALPSNAWREGVWHVRLATPDGVRLPDRYGVYNSGGIETIEVASTMIKGAQRALRLAAGNERLDVDIVPAADLRHGCNQPRTCYLVSANGDVTEFRSK